jgi:hypothetical protein
MFILSRNIGNDINEQCENHIIYKKKLKYFAQHLKRKRGIGINDLAL